MQGNKGSNKELPEIIGHIANKSRKSVLDKSLSFPYYGLSSRARNSAGECYLHTVEVVGSIPIAPISKSLIFRTYESHPRRKREWLLVCVLGNVFFTIFTEI